MAGQADFKGLSQRPKRPERNGQRAEGPELPFSRLPQAPTPPKVVEVGQAPGVKLGDRVDDHVEDEHDHDGESGVNHVNDPGHFTPQLQRTVVGQAGQANERGDHWRDHKFGQQVGVPDPNA